jgi:hypothetical protein
VMGTAAAAVQLLVPYVTYIAPEAVRGQAAGKVVSGVMIGILVARPLSSLVARFAIISSSRAKASFEAGGSHRISDAAELAREPHAP